MGVLVTTCPETGGKIETGIETDQYSLEQTPPFVTRIYCPHCAREHEIAKGDILVREMIDGVVHYLRAAA